MDNLITKSTALLKWSDLWPAQVQTHARGWTEQIKPGVHLLVDETGEEGRQWAAILTGSAPPGRGRVQCNGLCSQVDQPAYQAQVYWQKPLSHMQSREITAQQWMQRESLKWPHWDAAAWSRHCAGFGLMQHMDKPLWHLSTGCLRKLGIAAALASQATLTVIEEPVSALDAQSIAYLCKALEALNETLASEPCAVRWVLVVHWELLPLVTWNEVLSAPSLACAEMEHALREEAEQNRMPMQQSLLL